MGTPEEEARKFLDNLTPEEISKLKDTISSAILDVIKAEMDKLTELENEQKRLIERKEAVWVEERNAVANEKNTLREERQEIYKQLEPLELKILHQKNRLIAVREGGDLVSFTDKKGKRHEGIPDFTKIKTTQILFDEQTITTDEIPAYVPFLNEEAYRRRGFVLDAIRIDKNTYLTSINKHKDDSSEYVLLTLDQLVLVNDYYFTKAKGVLIQEARKLNEYQENWWDTKLTDERKEKYYSQKGLYHSLPAKEKKNITFDQYNALTWQEKDKIYKFFKRASIKRLHTVLEGNEMWISLHEMYERFINPDAVMPKPRFANQEVWYYWERFRNMMKWKIKDIRVQREDLSNSYLQAMETSFGDSNTNDALKEKFGIFVKRQNGSKINEIEINQIEVAWQQVQTVFGNLKTNAENVNMKISHTGEKFVFASKSIGMYVDIMNTIAVSNKYGADEFKNTLAHEVAHWIDNTIGKQQGVRYATDNYESTAGKIAFEFRGGLNKDVDSDYINATKECFARAFEQYFAIINQGEDATLIYSFKELDKRTPYYTADNYVNNLTFQNKIVPLINLFLEENKDFFKYSIVEQNNIQAMPKMIREPQNPQSNNSDKYAPLNKRFSHHSWFKDGKTTIKEAFDYFAQSGDFRLDKKLAKAQSSSLMDDVNYDAVLKYTGKEGGTYKLNELETEYFLERKEYWNKEQPFGTIKISEKGEEYILTDWGLWRLLRYKEDYIEKYGYKRSDVLKSFNEGLIDKDERGILINPDDGSGNLISFKKAKEKLIGLIPKLTYKLSEKETMKSNNNDKPSLESKQRFSPVKEVDRSEITLMPELFQGRQHAFSDETVQKIMLEGFDKSNDPIIVWWNPEKEKYVVISGHSRWEASSRLLKTGDKSLKTMPVKEFLGDQDEAVSYAVLESNRASTQEGLISDINAVRKMMKDGYNKTEMLKYIKPKSYLETIVSYTYLNPNGRFIEHLSQPSSRSFPYLERNAEWVGDIRRKFAEKLTDAHENEIFEYMYMSGGTGQLKLTKDQFYGLINSKVMKIDYNPDHPLSLQKVVSTNAVTSDAKEKLAELETEITYWQGEIKKKTDLIARARNEGHTEMIETFMKVVNDGTKKVIELTTRIQKLKTEISNLENEVVADLFSMADESPQMVKVQADIKKDESKQALETNVNEAESEINDCNRETKEFEKTHKKEILTVGSQLYLNGINHKVTAMDSEKITFVNFEGRFVKQQEIMLGYDELIDRFNRGLISIASYSTDDKILFDLMIKSVQICVARGESLKALKGSVSYSIDKITEMANQIKELASEKEELETKLSEVVAEKESTIAEKEVVVAEKEKALLEKEEQIKQALEKEKKFVAEIKEEKEKNNIAKGYYSHPFYPTKDNKIIDVQLNKVIELEASKKNIDLLKKGEELGAEYLKASQVKWNSFWGMKTGRVFQPIPFANTEAQANRNFEVMKMGANVEEEAPKNLNEYKEFIAKKHSSAKTKEEKAELEMLMELTNEMAENKMKEGGVVSNVVFINNRTYPH